MNRPTIPPHWRNHTFRAMGCQMTVWLEHQNADTAVPVLLEAEAMFRRAERRLSRFDAASELVQINTRPGVWTAVSDMMWQVVTQALCMARETDGLFDPTHLAALEAAGYTHSFDQLPLAAANGRVTPVSNHLGQWQTVGLNPETQSVWLPSGVKLDLGGIAKGYTAQQVVNFLSDWGPCLVDAGGDLSAGNAPTGWPGWPVALSAPYTSPDRSREELFPLWLVDGSMATSGIDYRRWRHNGRTAHHLIDPRTGQPAETDLLTATVLAKAATRAEAWATAALVAGTAVYHHLSARGLAAALIDHTGHLSLTPALMPILANISI